MGSFAVGRVGVVLLAGVVVGLAACGAKFTVEENPGTGGATGATATSVGGVNVGGSNSAGNGGSDPGDDCPANGVGWFSDDFEDSQLDPYWAIDSGDNAGERNGHLFIALNGESDSSTFVFSTERYTLKGCSATATVNQVPTCDGCIASFAVFDANNTDNALVVIRDGDRLLFEEYIGGSVTSSAFVQPENGPQLWRIRERMATITFATSADGVQWTPKHTVPTPPWAGDVRVEFSAAGRTDGNVEELQVEDFNAHP